MGSKSRAWAGERSSWRRTRRARARGAGAWRTTQRLVRDRDAVLVERGPAPDHRRLDTAARVASREMRRSALVHGRVRAAEALQRSSLLSRGGWLTPQLSCGRSYIYARDECSRNT